MTLKNSLEGHPRRTRQGAVALTRQRWFADETNRGRFLSALILSLIFHGLILSLRFGIPGIGLPGLQLPWNERRAQAPELTVRLTNKHSGTERPISSNDTTPAPPLPKAEPTPRHELTPSIPRRAQPERTAAPSLTNTKPRMSQPSPAPKPASDNHTKPSIARAAKPVRVTKSTARRSQPHVAKAPPRPQAVARSPAPSERFVMPAPSLEHQERPPAAEPVLPMQPIEQPAPQLAIPERQEPDSIAPPIEPPSARITEQEQIAQSVMAQLQERKQAEERAQQQALIKALQDEAEASAHAEQLQAREEARRQAMEAQAQQQAEESARQQLAQKTQEEERQRAEALRVQELQEERATREAMEMETARRQAEDAERQEAMRRMEEEDLARAEQVRAQRHEEEIAQQEALQREAERRTEEAAQQQAARQAEEENMERARQAEARRQQEEIAQREALERKAETPIANAVPEQAAPASSGASGESTSEEPTPGSGSGRNTTDTPLEASPPRPEQIATTKRPPAPASKPQADTATIPNEENGAFVLSEDQMASVNIAQARKIDVTRMDRQAARELASSAQESRRRTLLGSAKEDVVLNMYIESWCQEVERNGNQHYLQELQDPIRGSLLVTVAIRSDGSIEGIAINRPGAHRELDDAMHKIMQLTDQYPAFPADLKRRYDVIEVRRLWRFGDSLQLLEDAR